MPIWDADVELTPEAAAGLIDRQFPALAPAHLEALGSGWDNTAYRVNGRFVFRFPRRQIAAALIEREARVLPLLARPLPLPIPAPEFVGAPGDGYPYPFAGYPHLPGVTACRIPWTEAERESLAAPLGRFLAALHALPVRGATREWAPGDEFERANVARRVPMVREKLEGVLRAEVEGAGLTVAALRERVLALADTPLPREPPCWVHGDLYARHLLADADHNLCGVIDWGDVHLGDRGVDLSIAFSFLPPTARPAFLRAYGLPVDTALWDRARFRGLFYGVILTDYGRDRGDAPLREAGLYALRNAAQD